MPENGEIVKEDFGYITETQEMLNILLYKSKKAQNPGNVKHVIRFPAMCPYTIYSRETLNMLNMFRVKPQTLI